MIRRIWADNFKSLRNFELELRPFNVLVGANAAGKSNILDALWFIRDAAESSVGGALGRRRGWRGVAAPGSGERFRLGFADDVFWQWKPQMEALHPGDDQAIHPDVYEYDVEIHRLHTDERAPVHLRPLFEVSSEELRVLTPHSVGVAVHRAGNHQLWYSTQASMSGAGRGLPGPPINGDHLALSHLDGDPLEDIPRRIAGWQFLALVPEVARAGATPEDYPRLDRSGKGLAYLLKQLTETEHELVRDAMARDVPGFVDFRTETAADRTFFLVDEGSAPGLLPESVSDGTIRLLAIYALYHQSTSRREVAPQLVLIEEPENGLHPDLIETVVQYLRALSNETQVIITTHSPLLVNQCEPDEVVLVEKIDGATRAARVPERAQIQRFLRDFSLGELWTRDLLEDIVENGVGAGSPG